MLPTRLPYNSARSLDMLIVFCVHWKKNLIIHVKATSSENYRSFPSLASGETAEIRWIEQIPSGFHIVCLLFAHFLLLSLKRAVSVGTCGERTNEWMKMLASARKKFISFSRRWHHELRIHTLWLNRKFHNVNFPEFSLDLSVFCFCLRQQWRVFRHGIEWVGISNFTTVCFYVCRVPRRNGN